ncbi:MAG: BON domain-containing protein [Pirellulaceae bacterium]|jgi:hypothetical protein|nr:BON domain-containing protein [Pirellulaceae bacterium]
MARFGVSVAAILVAVVAVSFASADDTGILRQISDGLLRERDSDKLRGFDIRLTVTEGKVRLAGHVSTPEQLELVKKIAGRVDGVKEVDNQLKIRGPVASGSTKTEVPKPVNANAEQSQVRYSKAGGLAWDSTEWIAGGPRWGQLCGSTLNFVAVECLRFIEWLRRIAFTTSIDGIDREADEG